LGIDDATKVIPEFTFQNMPKIGYIKEDPIFNGFTAYFFTIVYISSLVIFVTNVVSEKEKKIKETMRIMGMRDSAFW
jgi:ATP-binding cassette subfamily A (ABC1) protein 5